MDTIEIHRLTEKGADMGRKAGIRLQIMGAAHQHDLQAGNAVSKLGTELTAIAIRQADIDQRKAHRLSLDSSRALSAATGGPDLITEIAQLPAQHLAQRRVVLDQQQRGF